jgi:hypothetical protein
MHAYEETHRRVVLLAYHRFLAADRSLREAQSSALDWVPGTISSKTMLMGDAGSPVRKLYERRNRALTRLTMVRRMLDEERRDARRRSGRSSVLLIASSSASRVPALL